MISIVTGNARSVALALATASTATNNPATDAAVKRISDQ